jgi:HPt (histidine-containing phosphotransfer) domain-containing protein
MTNPIVHAFFVGRALADALYEQAESSFTDALSELGKLDAELRDGLRQFSDRVLEKANRDEAAAMQGRSSAGSSVGFTTSPGESTADLQTLIDELRAEIARLRSELKQYRSRAS